MHLLPQICYFLTFSSLLNTNVHLHVDSPYHFLSNLSGYWLLQKQGKQFEKCLFCYDFLSSASLNKVSTLEFSLGCFTVKLIISAFNWSQTFIIMHQVVFTVFCIGLSFSFGNKDTSVWHTVTGKQLSLLQRNLKLFDYQILEYEIQYGVLHVHVCRSMMLMLTFLAVFSDSIF